MPDSEHTYRRTNRKLSVIYIELISCTVLHLAVFCFSPCCLHSLCFQFLFHCLFTHILYTIPLSTLVPNRKKSWLNGGELSTDDHDADWNAWISLLCLSISTWSRNVLTCQVSDLYHACGCWHHHPRWRISEFLPLMLQTMWFHTRLMEPLTFDFHQILSLMHPPHLDLQISVLGMSL